MKRLKTLCLFMISFIMAIAFANIAFADTSNETKAKGAVIISPSAIGENLSDTSPVLASSKEGGASDYVVSEQAYIDSPALGNYEACHAVAMNSFDKNPVFVLVSFEEGGTSDEIVLASQTRNNSMGIAFGAAKSDNISLFGQLAAWPIPEVTRRCLGERKTSIILLLG